MKEFIKNHENIYRIEFWPATTIYIFSVFFLISAALSNDWVPYSGPADAERNRINFYFISRLIRYTVLYGAFLLLNFSVVPKLIKKEAVVLNCLLVLLVFAVMGFIYGSIDTFLRYALLHERQVGAAAQNIVFQNRFLYAAWLLLMFGFYTVIKYAGLHLLSRAEAIQAKYRFVTPGGLAAFVLWMICIFLLIIAKAERPVTGVAAIVVPSAILFYWYARQSLIPNALSRKKQLRYYLLRTLIILLLAALPVFVISMLLVQDEDGAGVITSFNLAFQLLITAPFTWVYFKRRLKGKEEIYVLQKELGRSNANFDFLRSQINPHFLFNALNTIYGTAIQEGAERTSEGIEKLGDMMRFMLQENMQEKISLAREVEYLSNYISLQKLRTDPNPSIQIEAYIEQQVHTIQIAPMLLIPFVENAFKHGISFREPSHIKITLEVRESTLYFDVHNSKHIRSENDPEKGKSGIGLTNVKQRLQLLYPGKHELIIRETGKEFFIHLTLKLS